MFFIKFNYEIVEPLLNKNRNRDYKLAAQKMIDENLFLIPPYGRIPIDIEKDFTIEKPTRSLNRMIHANTFLGDLYTSYSETKDAKYVNYGEYIVSKWFDFKDKNTDYNMIYHDETTAQRMLYWLKFYYLCSDLFTEEFRIRFTKEIKETAELLITEDFHSTNTNHGMFQDIALLAYSILSYELPKASNEYQIAIRRLTTYFQNTYTLDGVHKEHSPDYHFMVTSNVKKIADVVERLSSNNNDDEDHLSHLFIGAEKYATHIIQPNLIVPKISDCSGFNINDKIEYSTLFDSDNFKYVKSNGKEGKVPNENQILFENSGYFISRSGWTHKDSYFLFLASYHAEYHKHSDDLSFILYKDGDIFIDSGPNGYDYDSKYTKYAYSGYAHSNLIVNNKPLLRHDANFDLVGIDKAQFDSNKLEFMIRGFNKRYEHTEHYRTINGNHKTGIFEISDEIISENHNEYLINFQLSNEINTVINNNIVSLFREDVKVAELEIEFKNLSGLPIINHHKGETYPIVQGFEFLKMGEETASPTISVKFYNETDKVTMKSTIRLDNFKINIPKITNEKSYGSNNIKYTMYEPKIEKTRLLVIFSAMMPSYDYKYNYYHTLKDVDSYQLYIKDDAGEYGNYYLGNNKNTDIQTEVISLIYNFISKYEIPLENVTLLGSSKGGFAALYYGMKYGFKNVIAGAPQTMLGNFVLEEAPHNNVAKVTSGFEDIGDKLYLNNALYGVETLREDFTHYFICVGSIDHHLKGHVEPFINHMNKCGHTLSYTEVPNGNHNDLKLFFKDYLYESLNSIYGTNLIYDTDYKNMFAQNYLVKHTVKKIDEQNLNIFLEISGKNYNIVYYILDIKNNIIFKSSPQTDSILKFTTEELLGKRIKLFIRNSGITKNYITPVIREIEKIIFNSSN